VSSAASSELNWYFGLLWRAFSWARSLLVTKKPSSTRTVDLNVQWQSLTKRFSFRLKLEQCPILIPGKVRAVSLRRSGDPTCKLSRGRLRSY